MGIITSLHPPAIYGPRSAEALRQSSGLISTSRVLFMLSTPLRPLLTQSYCLFCRVAAVKLHLMSEKSPLKILLHSKRSPLSNVPLGHSNIVIT